MQQLCYVPTIENSAGSASRGLNAAREHSGSFSFEDLHSYGRMSKVGLVLRVLKWRYLEKALN